MTLDDLKDLCRREWDACKGDLVTLWLTEKSYRELNDAAVAAHMQKRTELYLRSDYAELGPAHPAFDNVVNPVTGNPIRIRLAGDNAADIWNGNDRIMYSLPLGGDSHGSPQSL